MTLENQKRNFASLIENSFYEFSMQFAALKKAESYKGPDVRWVYTGFPGFNRIYDAKFDEKTTDARIDEVLEKFKTAKQSVLWFVGPTSTPADLGKRLLNHGVIHIDDWSGMALDLTKHELDTKLPRGMTVEEATDEEGLKLWGQVVSRAFLVPKFSADQFVQVFAELGTGGRCPWKRFIGRDHGDPVCAVTLFTATEAAGVYYAATMPDARRKGFGAAITNYAINDAVSRGFKTAVLQATRLSERVSREIGFTEYCKIGAYKMEV